MNCIKSLLNKEVVNLRTGECIGCVCDVLVDTACGMVSKIVVPMKNNILSIFSKNDFYYICWCDIVKVGEDLIIADVDICLKKGD